MRIISRRRLLEAAERHSRARPTILHWHEVAVSAVWKNLSKTRQTFPHADQVTVASKRTVTIFNLTTSFRLITAIHYNHRTVFILAILTHAEYDRDEWKKNL